MNRNLDDTLLTIPQLERLAREVGQTEQDLREAKGVHEKAAMWESWLLMVTRELRLEMFLTGQLVFRTELWAIPESKPIAIDPWFS